MSDSETTQAVLILAPNSVTVTVTKTRTGKRKAIARITGLTRLEFDALPGRAIAIGHPDNPTCWRKNVSVHIAVETQEPPARNKPK